MDKMKDFNLKKVLITLGELAILTIVCVFLYSNIFVWFKSTSYIGSTLTWIVIALILSLYGIFFSSENIGSMVTIEGQQQIVTMEQVISDLNTEFMNKITQIQKDNLYDEYDINSNRAEWKDILAIY